jgi:hypothetical protein
MTDETLKELFASDIHRRIEEVIKVDQADEQIIRDELAEYVVTDSRDTGTRPPPAQPPRPTPPADARVDAVNHMQDQRERGHQRAVLRQVRQQHRMVVLGPNRCRG